MKSMKLLGMVLLLLPTVAFLYACGGSGGSSSPSSATITGSVYAAPVTGATVVVLNSSGTTTIAGPVTTSSDGTYSVSIPTGDLSADLIFSSNSGTFDDEATGIATPAKEMAAYVVGGSLSSAASVNLDPASTIIADLVKNHGKTLTEANTIFSGAFGYAPNISVMPKNDSTAGAAERLAALRAITYSQLTEDLNLGPNEQFDLLTAIAEDLADGVLDGTNASTMVSLGSGTVPEDIENRFEHSLVSLLTNTTCNKTGLTTAEIGSLPFGKVALTNTYKVEYLPGMMPAAQGKTTFKIRITNRSDGSPASGLASSISLMPTMHMATMSHGTPVDSAITENPSGTYSCTVYYLMASGMGMGYWELSVKIGGMMGETATFYPAVGMAMSANTVRSTLKGQSDIISSMTGTEKRSYYLFRDGLVSGATSTFNIFISAKDTMMSYPAVSSGTTLHDEQNAAWTVNTMTVEASTDGSTWTAGTDNSGGQWIISSLSGLTSGSTGTVYVRMTVNGEQKTTNGSAPSGANGYATFTVTPGM